MSKILLINPRGFNVNSSTPLSLASLGAQLKKFGYAVKVIDAAAPYNKLSNEEILTELHLFKPDVVGVTIMTPFVKEAYSLIKAIRPFSEFIMAGGAHATILPEEVLQNGADVVVRKEGEITITELLGSYFSSGDLQKVGGISYKSNNSVVHNPDRGYIKDLDILPNPDKDLFNPSWYSESGKPLNETFGTMITSRGCPGRCTFCSRAVFQNRVRYNSAEYIIKQMQELRDKYGIGRYYMLDDNFVTNKKRLAKLCDLIKSNFPGATWACTSRIDNVSSESLTMMKEAGCTTITYGIESGCNRTLERINKRLTISKIYDVVKKSYDLGLDVCANWMLGYPFETVEDINETTNFVKKLDPYIRMHNAGFLIPFPGTELYEEHEHLTSVKEFWLN